MRSIDSGVNSDGLSPQVLPKAMQVATRIEASASGAFHGVRASFDALAADFDAVLTPSVPGEAPAELGQTGSYAFNAIWSLLQVPCVNVPGLVGPAGLPVGMTLTGPRFGDHRVLAVAAAVGALWQGAMAAAT